ncbi:MAG TPA: hypothetical protein VM802_12335 [Chitinophaga sp.]|uniref:HYC_CC_PP family protein n=1 Tax=Chitinophaga sp. TaxID=1869181 RepID=UPI002CAF496D|nr:hypothetical protein [Chitinophaga sp.]HVI45656.1 hypothetical protein [Chitinophaga sp.]
MKRFLAIFFAMLYTLLTSGFSVNMHYCMGKLASVKLQSAPADMCGKCGKPTKGMDCCKNEFRFCKVTETHQAAKALQTDFQLSTDLTLPVKVLSAPSLSSRTIPAFRYLHDPPEPPSNPIFLQNCTFLI